MPTIIIRSGRTGRWAKLHPASVRFIVSETLRHTLSSAGFITIMCGFRFSVQTTDYIQPSVPEIDLRQTFAPTTAHLDEIVSMQ
jgi:hypothetical protein